MDYIRISKGNKTLLDTEKKHLTNYKSKWYRLKTLKQTRFTPCMVQVKNTAQKIV